MTNQEIREFALEIAKIYTAEFIKSKGCDIIRCTEAFCNAFQIALREIKKDERFVNQQSSPVHPQENNPTTESKKHEDIMGKELSPEIREFALEIAKIHTAEFIKSKGCDTIRCTEFFCNAFQIALRKTQKYDIFSSQQSFLPPTQQHEKAPMPHTRKRMKDE